MSSHVCSGKIIEGGMVIRFERSSSKSNKKKIEKDVLRSVKSVGKRKKF